MMRTRRCWIGLALASTLIGCGGAAFNAGGNDSADSGGTSGTMDGATVPSDAGSNGDGGAVGDGAASPCPANVPSAGAACSHAGLECEYGTSPVTSCNTVATCTQAAWVITPPDSSGGACRGSLDSNCPATYTLVPKGGHCTEPNLVCDYPRGRCACESPTGTIVVMPLDAGADTWVCQTAPTGCPDPRPFLGTACTPNGTVCDYGSCSVPGGTTEECVDGFWQENMSACAVAQ